jgi:hypothetical protein
VTLWLPVVAAAAETVAIAEAAVTD